MHMADRGRGERRCGICARSAPGKPLWQLLADLAPEEMVDLVDFRYLTDALDPATRRWRSCAPAEPGRAEREARLLADGYPAYATSPGWLGYSDEKLARLCREAVDEGFTHDQAQGRRRPRRRHAPHARSRATAVGPDIRIAIDANQRWDVAEAIDWVRRWRRSTRGGSRSRPAPTTCSATPRSAAAVAPVRVATGEHVANRVMFKQLLQAERGRRSADRRLPRRRRQREHGDPPARRQVRRAGVPARGRGRACASWCSICRCSTTSRSRGTREDRVIEYVDHLHEHFVDPVVIVRPVRGPDRTRLQPGCGPRSLADDAFPDGAVWRPDGEPRHGRLPGMTAGEEFQGLAAVVTGGASGIGLATAALLRRGARRVACSTSSAGASRSRCYAVAADVTRRRVGRRRGEPGRANASAGWTCWSTTPASARRAPSRTTPTTSGIACFDVNVLGIVRTEPGRAAAPAPVRARRDRQHLLDRGHGRACRSGRSTRERRARCSSLTLAMAADHVARGDPRQLRQPRHRGHPVGRAAAGRGRRPGGRTRRAGGPPADRAAWSPPSEVAAAIAYLAGPLAASTTGTSWRWTEACRACASAPVPRVDETSTVRSPIQHAPPPCRIGELPVSRTSTRRSPGARVDEKSTVRSPIQHAPPPCRIGELPVSRTSTRRSGSAVGGGDGDRGRDRPAEEQGRDVADRVYAAGQ